MNASKDDLIDALLEIGISTRVALKKMTVPELRAILIQRDPISIGRSRTYLINYIYKWVGIPKGDLKGMNAKALVKLARDIDKNIEYRKRKQEESMIRNMTGEETPPDTPLSPKSEEALKQFIKALKGEDEEEPTPPPKEEPPKEEPPKEEPPQKVKKPRGKKQTITEKPQKELLPHQDNFVKAFFTERVRAAIAFHEVGSGKTVLAAAAAKLYLQLFPQNRVLFLSPASVLKNMIDEIGNIGGKCDFMSYTKFERNDSKFVGDKTLIICDEAHHLRNQKTKKFSSVSRFKAHKVILMTGTPFINEPYDIEALIGIVDGIKPFSISSFYNVIDNDDLRADHFRYKISRHKNVRNEFFPESTTNIIAFPTANESDLGRKILANANIENSFYSRSIFSSITDDKFRFILDHIKEGPNKKYVIHVPFLEALNKLYTDLTREGIKCAKYTGSERSRSTGVDQYNADTINVLLVSDAGAEGLDLKNTYSVILTVPQWNRAAEEQIIARAIRYKSHYTLPKKDQHVNIYRLFQCYESEMPKIEQIKANTFDYFSKLTGAMSTDLYLYITAARKQITIDKFINELASIPKLEGLLDKFDNAIFKKIEEDPKITDADIKKEIVEHYTPKIDEIIKKFTPKPKKVKKKLRGHLGFDSKEEEIEYLHSHKEDAAKILLSTYKKDTTILINGNPYLMTELLKLDKGCKADVIIDSGNNEYNDVDLVKNIIKTLPDNFTLLKTQYFTRYAANKEYDYVYWLGYRYRAAAGGYRARMQGGHGLTYRNNADPFSRTPRHDYDRGDLLNYFDRIHEIDAPIRIMTFTPLTEDEEDEIIRERGAILGDIEGKPYELIEFPKEGRKMGHVFKRGYEDDV